MAQRQQPRKHKVKGYGWRPDLPDAQDHLFAASLETLAALPASVDLRPQCPPVYDQGELGSCTANATAGALQFERERQNLSPDFVPSRLFIYYNERVIEGTTSYDSGAQLRDGIKAVARIGACAEADWPYVIGNFAERPPQQAYEDAALDQAVNYSRIGRRVTEMRACLAGGFPFVFGFSVYESFESEAVARTGVVPMPGRREALLGGHAVMAVGYVDEQQRFICRNSWGSGWGLQGYFTIPYAYLTDRSLASDFWTIRLVSAD